MLGDAQRRDERAGPTPTIRLSMNLDSVFAAPAYAGAVLIWPPVRLCRVRGIRQTVLSRPHLGPRLLLHLGFANLSNHEGYLA